MFQSFKCCSIDTVSIVMMKGRRKPNIDVNVSQGWSNECANFQLKRSKVKVRVSYG